MKVKEINVPFYKWKIVSIVAESYNDFPSIAKQMKRCGLGKDNINDVKEMFEKQANGGAIIYYNDSRLLTVVICYPHPDTVELVSTLIHEGRHAADRIISSTQLDGVEGPAYLNEYITLLLIKEYIIYEKFNYETDKSNG